MALIVQKYGGTSNEISERILNVARRVKRWASSWPQSSGCRSCHEWRNQSPTRSRKPLPKPLPREFRRNGVYRRTGDDFDVSDGAEF